MEIRSANLSSALKLIMDPRKVRAEPGDFFHSFFFFVLLLFFYGFNIGFLISSSLLLFYSSVSVAAHVSDSLRRLVSSSRDECIKVRFKVKKRERKEGRKKNNSERAEWPWLMSVEVTETAGRPIRAQQEDVSPPLPLHCVNICCKPLTALLVPLAVLALQAAPRTHRSQEVTWYQERKKTLTLVRVQRDWTLILININFSL